jgi:hypothetical protein
MRFRRCKRETANDRPFVDDERPLVDDVMPVDNTA